MTLIYAAGVWLGVHYAYVIVMAGKSARDAGKLTKYWRVHLEPVKVLGGILDLAFNYTFGWMFLAKPRPYLFTQTVQYHYTHSAGWRRSLARFFAKQLNVFDDHIK